MEKSFIGPQTGTEETEIEALSMSFADKLQIDDFGAKQAGQLSLERIEKLEQIVAKL